MTKNIFFLFAPKFLNFGCDVAKEYFSQGGKGKVYGLNTGTPRQREIIESDLGELLGRVWDLEEQELSFEAKDADYEYLLSIDRKYGAGTVGELITSDRRIGKGLVSGGLCRPDSIGYLSTKKTTLYPQQYVSCLFKFLERMFDEANPSLVFCYAVAGAPALALGKICKQRGIQFARLSPTRTGNRYVVDDDIYERLFPVSRKFKEAKQDPAILDKWMHHARELRVEFERKPSLPEYMIRNNKLIKEKTLFRDGGGFLRDFAASIIRLKFDAKRRLALKRKAHELFIQWRRLCLSEKFSTRIPENREFIYYPLHVEPEASTMVLSPHHTNQIAVIEALSKSAPGNMVVVVKEHLPMLGRRPKGFYELISQMPRVLLVSPEQNSLSLIESSSMVAVITGTACWEALRIKKPALVIGESPYLVIGQGLVYEPCLAKLPEAILRTLSIAAATDKNIELYLASIISESFELNSEMLWGNYEICSRDDKNRVAKNIVEKIKNLEARI